MKKIDILKKSLVKKEEEFSRKVSEHFNDVKSTNGQPLNDKKNGAKTFRRWDRQNETLRKLSDSIEKTKIAIENETLKNNYLENISKQLPVEILDMVKSGVLIQWRKYPNIFFVNGVEKARIIYDLKKKIVAYKYYSKVQDIEQRKRFASIYNQLYNNLSKK